MNSVHISLTGLILGLSLSLPLYGAADGTAEKKAADKDTTIRWPLPPAKARVVYLESLYGEPEEKEGGFWSSLANFIFGEKKLNYFVRPFDVAASVNGVVVVTDPGSKGIHIFNRTSDEYQFVQAAGESELLSPLGIIFANEEEFYVVDSEARAVYLYSVNGEMLKKISDKSLLRPTDVAVHPLTKDVYVLDTPSHTIHVFNRAGKKTTQVGKRGTGPGEFNFPTSIAISSSATLYVSDSLNFRVQIFDNHNRPLKQFGKLGDRVGEFSKPKGIAVDRDENIYVVDSHFNHMLIYDKNGRFLLPLGGNGSSPGEFNIPTGIAIKSDTIYIVDSYNRRVQILKLVS